MQLGKGKERRGEKGRRNKEKKKFKVFWSSENRSFVFNQIFVYGTLMGVDYKSEKKI